VIASVMCWSYRRLAVPELGFGAILFLVCGAVPVMACVAERRARHRRKELDSAAAIARESVSAIVRSPKIAPKIASKLGQHLLDEHLLDEHLLDQHLRNRRIRFATLSAFAGVFPFVQAVAPTLLPAPLANAGVLVWGMLVSAWLCMSVRCAWSHLAKAHDAAHPGRSGPSAQLGALTSGQGPLLLLSGGAVRTSWRRPVAHGRRVPVAGFSPRPRDGGHGAR
jgi:hypothetical protein